MVGGGKYEEIHLAFGSYLHRRVGAGGDTAAASGEWTEHSEHVYDRLAIASTFGALGAHAAS